MSYPPPPVAYGQSPPPQYPLDRPSVYPWFVAYAIGMALLYGLCVGVGAFLAFGPVRGSAKGSDEETVFIIQGVALMAVGVFLAAAFGVAPLLPRRPGVWIYDLVLICLGLTSVCLLPATIPLLIFWIKPQTKQWFGRT